VRPIVTQFHLEAGSGPHGKLRVQARHPEHISAARGAAANLFGPRVLALAVDRKHRLGVPERQSTDLRTSSFRFEASHAACVRACTRWARRALPTFPALVETLRHSAVVHGDRTGWRSGGPNAWLGVFSAAKATVYWVTPGRGHDVAALVLGADCGGVFVCDGAKEGDALEDDAKARCLGQVLRRCRDLVPVVSAAEGADLDVLHRLLREALDLGRRRADGTAGGSARRVQAIENRRAAWRFAPRRRQGPEWKRRIDHLCAHRGEWLVFLHQVGVPPTNHPAEQLLRPAVLRRKIGGCNQTEQGAATPRVLSSMLVTAQRLGQTLVDWAVRWLRQGPATALPP
jgi:transposase